MGSGAWSDARTGLVCLSPKSTAFVNDTYAEAAAVGPLGPGMTASVRREGLLTFGPLGPGMTAFARREGLPTFKPEQLRLEALLAEGRRLAQEQEHVNRWRLSEEYMRNTGTQQSSLIGLSG
jgi:hypothetical protein